jgi:hypothetical protein
MMLRWSIPCAALLAGAAACSSDVFPPVDRCFILVARIVPEGPVLDIGDTMTLRASFGGRTGECVPADTTPAALRWIAEQPGAITVDSVSGLLTAHRPGWSGIIVVPRNGGPGGGPVLGTTAASVREPPSADSLISVAANLTADSVTVALSDASGAMIRTVTLAAGRSTCWNTPLPDSMQYSAAVYLPGQSSATSLGAKWVVPRALAFTHTWQVHIDPQSSGPPTLDLAGVTPDRGC